MKNNINNMIQVDSEGNFSSPDLITISDLLKIHDLEIHLPKQVLDAEVDACLKSSTFTKINDKYEFKFEEYSVIINPNDSERTILELEGDRIPRYFSLDGSHHIDYRRN